MSRVFMFNPYTGKPRHPSDIQSDPEGILLMEPGAPLYAAVPPAAQPVPDVSEARLKTAREAAAHKAFKDVLCRFDYNQRKHIANLMAHKWTIGRIVMHSKYCKGDEEGQSNYSDLHGAVAIDTALASIKTPKPQDAAAPQQKAGE